MSQAPFVQTRLGDGHFMDSSQKAYNMWTNMIVSTGSYLQEYRIQKNTPINH